MHYQCMITALVTTATVVWLSSLSLSDMFMASIMILTAVSTITIFVGDQ